MKKEDLDALRRAINRLLKEGNELNDKQQTLEDFSALNRIMQHLKQYHEHDSEEMGRLRVQNQHKERPCPACGEGRLEARESTQQVENAGVEGAIPLHYAVCDACGSEVAEADEARANKRAMMNESPDVNPPAEVSEQNRIEQHGFGLKKSFRHRSSYD